MLLSQLRDRIKQRFASEQTPEQARTTATDARQDRSDTVTELRQEVSRLQSEIADVSRSADPNDPTAVADPRLKPLQDELEQKQRDLARLQGRI